MQNDAWGFVVPALGVLFVALKLTHVITWSWWLVLLPFYAWIIMLFIIFLIAVVVKALS